MLHHHMGTSLEKFNIKLRVQFYHLSKKILKTITKQPPLQPKQKCGEILLKNFLQNLKENSSKGKEHIKEHSFLFTIFHMHKISCQIQVESLRKMHSFIIDYNMQLFLFVVITFSILTKANKRFHANLTNKWPK